MMKQKYASAQEVKWCAGCGDYSVLKQTQLALAELNLNNEEIVFVSGIGCSSRFPYYLDTYGYHTIHGRALAVATGVKCQNPNLSVWVTIGDGDALSIGGNHFIHAAKRNIDIVVILMDNRIYGLTKGQLSPTSAKGKVTRTTPYGSISDAMDPAKIALGAGASFVARTTDVNQKLLKKLLIEAHQHKGFSLVHVLQNCIIFNNGEFDDYVGKGREDKIILLEQGEPMVYGKEKDKAIVLDGLTPGIADPREIGDEKILRYDASDEAALLPSLVTGWNLENFPMPMGIIRQVEKPSYEDDLRDLINVITTDKGEGSLEQLLRGNQNWTVS